MSRKKRKQLQQAQTASNGRLVVDDDAYRPFKDVKDSVTILPEKGKTGSQKAKRKDGKPGLVVSGADKGADFGAILDAWTGGQDPDKVKAGETRKQDDKRSFADIFSEWEQSQGVKPKHQVKKPKIKKSQPYQQTKDFGAILNQYEGNKPARQKSQATKQEQEPVAKVHDPNLRQMKSEVKVSGKSFGELLDQYEGAEPKKEQKPEPVSRPHNPDLKQMKSEVKVSGKSFGELLDQYEGIVPAKAKETGQESPVQSHEGKSEVQSSGKGFGEILETFEGDKAKEKEKPAWSFADIYKDWAGHTDEKKAIERSKETRHEKEKDVLSIRELRAMQPQVTLDLHGYKAEEAAKAVKVFLEDSDKHNLLKVCIIPGKGIHAQSGVGVLKDVVLSEIRLSGLVREAYSPKACYGGSGVIWVILKDRNSL